jgi:UDP-2-acetamido-2-deoxy-ribo-hexuluronate aminotransferase
MEGQSMRFMDLQTPSRRYAAQLQARMNAVLEHGAFILGPEVVELEAALAAYVGVEHVIGVASGTQSLELALRALGVGPGDEVISVAFTFVGSVDPIALIGATPVFVDIDPTSFTLDPSLLERAITARTRAIIAVSLFGHMADYDAINAIAARHGLPVIEDAAQSFGASQAGGKSCGRTSIASTSFFPTKPLGALGDGGALFTNDAGLAERMRALGRHGKGARGEYELVGTNSRLDTLQAAALLVKLEHLESELAARERIAARYSEALRHVVQVPSSPALARHVYALYTIRAKSRDELARRLAERGIPTGIYYPRCLHQQPWCEKSRSAPLPESERAAREVLSLPMHPFLTETEQASVIAAVLDCRE